MLILTATAADTSSQSETWVAVLLLGATVAVVMAPKSSRKSKHGDADGNDDGAEEEGATRRRRAACRLRRTTLRDSPPSCALSLNLKPLSHTGYQSVTCVTL